jgi:steroid Delta-isomerase
MAVTPATVRQTLENYVRAWRTGDKALVLSLFAADCVWNDPVGTPPFQGLDGVSRFWDFAHQDAGRQLHPRLERIIACANEGILHFVMEVRAPQLNQGLDLTVIERFVLDDAGKIRSAQAYWDEQCVAVPPGMQLFAPNIDEAYDKN